jgi:hypothetical protein
VSRQGLGARVAAEYDLYLDSRYPRHNEWVAWFTVGLTQVASTEAATCPARSKPLGAWP